MFSGVPADKANITILQLLTHSAGFIEAVGPDEERLTREAFLARAFASKLRAPPGRRYHYSNAAGFSVLAAAIETRSGMSYEQFLRDEVLRATRHRTRAICRSPMMIADPFRRRTGARSEQASWGGHENPIGI